MTGSSGPGRGGAGTFLPGNLGALKDMVDAYRIEGKDLGSEAKEGKVACSIGCSG